MDFVLVPCNFLGYRDFAAGLVVDLRTKGKTNNEESPEKERRRTSFPTPQMGRQRLGAHTCSRCTCAPEHGPLPAVLEVRSHALSHCQGATQDSTRAAGGLAPGEGRQPPGHRPGSSERGHPGTVTGNLGPRHLNSPCQEGTGTLADVSGYSLSAVQHGQTSQHI